MCFELAIKEHGQHLRAIHPPPLPCRVERRHRFGPERERTQTPRRAFVTKEHLLGVGLAGKVSFESRRHKVSEPPTSILSCFETLSEINGKQR